MAEDQKKPKPVKYFDSQFDDEEVLYVFRRHPVIMRTGLVVSMSLWLVGPLIILALTYIMPNNPPSMVAFFLAVIGSIVFGSLVILPWWIGWYFSLFIMTSQRFVQITQKGLFHTSFADISLPQIQQVNYEVSGLQETLLGFGTITMQTYIGELVIHDVPHPAKIQRKIVQILRDQGVTPVALGFQRGIPERVK
ncbi:MAG TPA: PH domain-containing protein [Verrucomicrobiae bacterium]|nr:PH domain-containing protein [Verrucomicrobiae bacterium]